MQNPRGVGDVFVDGARPCEALRDQSTCQVVAPQVAHCRRTHRLAKIGAHAHGDAHALQPRGAKHGDGLHDARRRVSRRVERRIRNSENLAGKRGVRGDECAQLVQLDVLFIHQLQHTNRDLGKRRQAQVRPGQDGCFFVRLPGPHRAPFRCGIAAPARSRPEFFACRSRRGVSGWSKPISRAAIIRKRRWFVLRQPRRFSSERVQRALACGPDQLVGASPHLIFVADDLKGYGWRQPCPR